MSILPITLYGDEILKKKAKPVKNIDGSIKTLVEDMFQTMYNADGVGLAANQVGSSHSIFVIDLKPIEGFEKHPPVVMINPKILELSENIVDIEEGCLSVPYVRAKVARPQGIKIKYYDLEQNELVLERDDFLARVIQHEFDHLQGFYFTDRLELEMQKMLRRNLKKIRNRSFDFEYPVTP